MALRSPSRTTGAAATSGPGRAPASDGRHRHRRRASPVRSPARHGGRHAAPEELRRRAEALFAGHPAPEGRHGESSKGPPPPDGAGAGAGEWPDGQAEAPLALSADDRAGTSWRERTGQAVRERMPVWLQTRCGLERRGAAALAALLLVAVVLAVQHYWSGRAQPVAAPEVVREAAAYGAGAGGAGSGGVGAAGESAARGSASAPTAPGGVSAEGSAGAEIVVDVGGKVRRPGIHRLPAGSRVADALRAAGGVRPGTKTDGLNQARLLVDGEQVVVGDEGAAAGGGLAQGGRAGVPGGQGPPGGLPAAGAPVAPVSLNAATADQLDTLPGVGPVLAQHIIDYRAQHGGFRSVNELREVNGIGERRFADLRDLVRP